MSSFLGGWFMLNAQKQRQDRYFIPAYPVMAAMVGHSWMALTSLYYSYKIIVETQKLYAYKGPTPAQRDYEHHIDTAGANWPTPSVSYWPINQNPNKWGVDDMLKEVRKYFEIRQTLRWRLLRNTNAPLIDCCGSQGNSRWSI